MATAAEIIDLRRVLAERFPHAQLRLSKPPTRVSIPTGVASLDTTLGGGLPVSEVTELVGHGMGSGTAQVLHALLRQTAAMGRFVALIDGSDSLDIDPMEPETLARLLWVRCTHADQALKAADLVLRDRNFPLVILDLKLNPNSELRRIRASVWPRLDRLREHHRTTLLVITPTQLVGGAFARVWMANRLGLSASREAPEDVLQQLQFEARGGRSEPSMASNQRVA